MQYNEKKERGLNLTDIVPPEDHGRDRALLMAPILRSLKEEGAATAIEYGLIAAGIAVAMIPVITGVGAKLKTTFSTIQSALK